MKGLRLSISIYLLSFIFILYPIIAHADDSDTDAESNNEIDISLNPSDMLFNIENMKPGDWAPRSVTVQNDGTMDFVYHIHVENIGHQKLFNELLLDVVDANSVELYNGKLSEFSHLDSRELNVSEEEDLTLTIRFPEQLGNDFQGTDSQFKLIFTAEAKDTSGSNEKDSEEVGGNLDSGSNDNSTGLGSILPTTATNIFTFIIIGLALAVFGGLLFVINRKLRDVR